jgi:hypothetical protein
MPSSTPVYNIPFPCAGENIDCDIFEDWAQAIQDAIVDTRALETRILNRPSARASGTAQAAFVAGVNTNLVYQTEDYDNNAIVDLVADSSRFLIQTTGWYLFASSAELNQIAGMTSQAISLTHNGTVIYRRKSSSPAVNANPTPGIQVIGLINCAQGDAIRSTFLFTGAAAPIVNRVTTFGYLVSQA